MPTVGKGLFRWFFCSGARLEDFADRLNHVWTFGLLLILGAVISWKYGYESPISCWSPAQFGHAQVAYTHQTCWNSYFIQYSFEKNEENELQIPIVTQELSGKYKYDVTFYQWVPIILCMQALLFKLPNIFMYILHGHSGIDFDKIAGLTDGYQNLSLSERHCLAYQISRYIYRWSKMFPRGFPWRLLTALWFLIKCMYCINVVIQMAYIDKFLKTKNRTYYIPRSYGVVIYDNIATNNASMWRVSQVFPRKVMCEFSIKQLQNVQQYRVQCDLVANHFTESAYMFLWVWLLFVSVVTMISFLSWVLSTLLAIGRKRYIKRFIELGDCTTKDAAVHVSDQDVSLVTSLLGQDGVMVLKLVAANASELLVGDVVCSIARLARGGNLQTTGQVIQQPPPVTTRPEPTAPPGMYPMIDVGKP